MELRQSLIGVWKGFVWKMRIKLFAHLTSHSILNNVPKTRSIVFSNRDGEGCYPPFNLCRPNSLYAYLERVSNGWGRLWSVFMKSERSCPAVRYRKRGTAFPSNDWLNNTTMVCIEWIYWKCTCTTLNTTRALYLSFLTNSFSIFQTEPIFGVTCIGIINYKLRSFRVPRQATRAEGYLRGAKGAKKASVD